jgi:hypothetical protein
MAPSFNPTKDPKGERRKELFNKTKELIDNKETLHVTGSQRTDAHHAVVVDSDEDTRELERAYKEMGVEVVVSPSTTLKTALHLNDPQLEDR